MGMSLSFKKLAYTQIVLGIIAYAVAEGNAVLVLAGGTLSVLSWYIVEGPGGKPLPEWLLNIGVIGATAWLFYSQLPPAIQPLIYSLGQFLICMQLFKLYEKKNNRDWAQLIVLSLMQTICALIISNELLFGVLMVIYMGVTLFSVLTFQLKVGHDEVIHLNETQAPPGFKPAPAPAVSSRHFKRHFNALTAISGFGCLLISMVVFIVLPRGQGAGLFGDWPTTQPRTQTGAVGDQVPMDATGEEIVQSRSPVLHLRVLRDGDTIAPEELDVPLLRGNVHDVYRSRKWNRGHSSPPSPNSQIAQQDRALNDKDSVHELLGIPEQNPGALSPVPTLLQEITLRDQTKGVLYALYPAIRVTSNDVKGMHFNAIDQVLSTRQTVAGGGQYTVESYARPVDLTPLYQRRFNPEGKADFDWKNYARGPVLPDPRIFALANNILDSTRLKRDPAAVSTFSDHAIAQAIMEYLQAGDYKYTTRPPATNSQSEDPILVFLFGARRGHCEWFASGMCALVRSLGLRARLVSGFRVAEYNSVAGYCVIRKKNSHMWLEVWQDGAGWKPFDPSPPSDVAAEHKPSGGLLGFFRDLYGLVEERWINTIITYDASQRQSVMGSMSQNLDGLTNLLKKIKEWIDQTLADVRQRFLYDTFGFVVFLLAGGVIVVTLVVSLSIMIRRRRLIQQLQLESLSRRAQRQLVKHLEFYLSMLNVLEKAGFIKPLWQTPASFASQLELQNATRFAPVVPLTDLFYEIRFGGRPFDQDRSKTIHGLLESLRQTV